MGGLEQLHLLRLKMRVLEAHDDAVVGVVRLFPSGLASGPFRILNDNVLPAVAATPL